MAAFTFAFPRPAEQTCELELAFADLFTTAAAIDPVPVDSVLSQAFGEEFAKSLLLENRYGLSNWSETVAANKASGVVPSVDLNYPSPPPRNYVSILDSVMKGDTSLIPRGKMTPERYALLSPEDAKFVRLYRKYVARQLPPSYLTDCMKDTVGVEPHYISSLAPLMNSDPDVVSVANIFANDDVLMMSDGEEALAPWNAPTSDGYECDSDYDSDFDSDDSPTSSPPHPLPRIFAPLPKPRSQWSMMDSSPLKSCLSSSPARHSDDTAYTPSSSPTAKRKAKRSIAPKKTKKVAFTPEAVKIPLTKAVRTSPQAHRSTSCLTQASTLSAPRVRSPISSSPRQARPKRGFPCPKEGCNQVCASAGDLSRHLESLLHKPKSYICLACDAGYTRGDALKRHHRNEPSHKGQHIAAGGTYHETPPL